MTSKKAQAWGFDLMIASIIFISGMLLFYMYSINYPKEGNEKLDKLFNNGEFIAEVLLSEGLPQDWNQISVTRIGLTTDKKINDTKLKEFYELANNEKNQDGYKKAKSLFNTNYNFFMNFSEPITFNSEVIDESGIGKDFTNEQVTNLIKVTRITTYQNRLVSLNLYIWE